MNSEGILVIYRIFESQRGSRALSKKFEKLWKIFDSVTEEQRHYLVLILIIVG